MKIGLAIGLIFVQYLFQFVRTTPLESAPGIQDAQNPVGALETPIAASFVSMPAGEFTMGCDEEKGRFEGNECFGPDPPAGPRTTSTPAHRVSMTKGFEMGKYEVTQAQWEAVMKTNPSLFRKSPNLPVESVSRSDIHAYLDALNAKHDGYLYRVPREAEWEYAARAGVTPGVAETGSFRSIDRDFEGRIVGSFANPLNFPPLAGTLDEKTWYSNNSGGQTHPVGQKAPNAWGLYDMLGNVAEEVQDYFSRFYSDGSEKDPTGSPDKGFGFTARGGGWDMGSQFSNVWSRFPIAGGDPKEIRKAFVGFRCVRVPAASAISPR